MPDKFERKVENATKGVQALKRFWAEFKGLVYAILVGVIGFGYIVKNPDLIMKKVEQTFIHNEVEEATNNSYATSPLRRKDSLYIADLEYKVRALSVKVAKITSRVAEVEQENKDQTLLIEANEKHSQFNTIATSIACDAIKEEMDKKENGCGWTYYETNGGDNWNIFPDYYESSILYSVDLRSECRAYYTPIFRSKIKAN